MVHFMLMITGELENITHLQPQGGPDDPNFAYYIKLKCGNCGELSAKETCVSLSETVPLPNSRGTVNVLQKCKFCGRDGSILMVPGRGRPLTLDVSQSGKSVSLMMFDCRGFEPADFSFGDGWKAESLSGTPFDGIDLSGGEFAEYDEKGQCPVTISNLRATFVVISNPAIR
eukprot:TRINITY_DN386_c1_g1_i1.p1 TRINITY_DN386_c1_g1~~TRINITY_DN386_c1_g1_i1.p1  ORF type:complete len:172 (-),score=25.00 TRINITY_DN386_c1_g1_i1:387-902(-)